MFTMTPDLRLVAYAIALAWLMILGASVIAAKLWTPAGTKQAMGNRDEPQEVSAAGQRAKRATANMLENLPLFIGLVLVAHLGGRMTATALLGARIWFWARVLYWPVYVAGIPVVRSLVWAVSIVGLGMIFAQIITAAG